MSQYRRNDGSTRPVSRDARGTGPPRWGTLPVGRGIVLVISAAAAGAAATILTGREPGFLLGLPLVLGAIAAAAAVRRRAVHRIIPAPALAYLAAAFATGLIHDRAAGTSRTALVIKAAQWTASGFVPMTTATALVIAIALLRCLPHRHRPPASGDRPAPVPDGDSRRQPGRSHPPPDGPHQAGYPAYPPTWTRSRRPPAAASGPSRPQ